MEPVDHVAFQARYNPGRLALLELASGRSWDYTGLDDAVARCASVLRHGHRVACGDRVAALAKNCAELVLLHLACSRIGAIYVPLNWRLTASELNGLLADVEPRLLLGDGELQRSGLAGTSLAALSEDIAAAQPLPAEPIDPDRPALILFTSGTSGRPKGAMLSERNLNQTGLNLGRLGRVTHDSRFLMDSPMFHIIGLATNIRPPLIHGGAALISDAFDPARTLTRLADPALAVTHYFCVPQMAAMLRQQPTYDPGLLRGLTALFTGGAPHPAGDILRWTEEGIAAADGFGMSEAGTVFGMPVELDTITAKAGSVGIPTPGLGVRIVDGEDRDCPAGSAGELLLKGDNVFSGYWRAPEENARCFTADGWFRTGDIALCDSDGFYRIVDRKKDMFISGGENVYPAEIEAAMAGYPGLEEVAVVGVPDSKWGEVGHMALVASPGQTIDTAAVSAWLDGRLARYKLPKLITVVDSLPRTGSGKIIKSELRALLQ